MLVTEPKSVRVNTPAVAMVSVPRLSNTPSSRFRFVIVRLEEVETVDPDRLRVNVASARLPPKEKLAGNTPVPSIINVELLLLRMLPPERT